MAGAIDVSGASTEVYIASVSISRPIGLAACGLVFAATMALAQEAAQPSGVYSRKAVELWSNIAGSSKPFDVPSPDGLSRVRARYVDNTCCDEKVLLDVSGTIGYIQVDLGPGVASELLWSRDSTSFFVTTSDQGANGSYRLLVVGQFQGKLISRDLTWLVYKKFGHPVACQVSESPNVGGITWLGKTGHVLVAAEIVHHSVCDSAGTFKAYEIDPVTMQVIRSYSQVEAKRLFMPVLGYELRDASDDCIRRPQLCYLAANHRSK